MSALVCDMDGVLLDGEPLHFAAAQEILREQGIHLDLAGYQRYMGRTGREIWDDLRRRVGLRLDFQTYARRYDVLVHEKYRTQSVPLPGARALLDGVRDQAVSCALASSSRRGWVETALDVLGFRRYFSVIVTGDAVRRGKPDPEIYQTAAAQLGVDPQTCVVLEDAPAGVEAARAAGMRVIGVRTAYTQGLPLPGAERIIDSLVDFQMDWLRDEVPCG